MPIRSAQAFFTNPTATPISYLTCINNRRLFIKQDYLNHPIIQGNKWRKLKYTLLAAEKAKNTLISFGGAYSNHIAALAAVGQQYGLTTVGIIRGEELSNSQYWSKTLKTAAENGMKLHFVSRSAYRSKENHPNTNRLIRRYRRALLIPEGGSNALSLLGTAEVIAEIAAEATATKQNFNQLFAACGTGGTLAGLIDGAAEHLPALKITGIPVLKNADFLYAAIRALSRQHTSINWSLNLDYHFGGYARTSPELHCFTRNFQQRHHIPLDPIYTAKLFFAVLDLAMKSPSGIPENWLIYHSGGLQGIQYGTTSTER